MLQVQFVQPFPKKKLKWTKKVLRTLKPVNLASYLSQPTQKQETKKSLACFTYTNNCKMVVYNDVIAAACQQFITSYYQPVWHSFFFQRQKDLEMMFLSQCISVQTSHHIQAENIMPLSSCHLLFYQNLTSEHLPKSKSRISYGPISCSPMPSTLQLNKCCTCFQQWDIGMTRDQPHYLLSRAYFQSPPLPPPSSSKFKTLPHLSGSARSIIVMP